MEAFTQGIDGEDIAKRMSITADVMYCGWKNRWILLRRLTVHVFLFVLDFRIV